MHTNFRHLAYVVEVANLGSITAASETIGISQPAISAAIKSVEDQVGYQIFIRNPSHGISLTQAGRQFINNARNLLDNVHHFEKTVTGLGDELSGDLQVGCYTAIAPFIIPRLLVALRNKYPKIDLTIRETDMSETIHDIKNGVTDVAISFDFLKEEGIDYDLLFETTPHVIVSTNDPISEQEVISLHDLYDKPLVLLDMEKYYEQLFALYNLEPNIIYRLKSFEMIRGLVGVGVGYSFGRLPIKIERTYDGSVLVRRPIYESVPKSRICLVTRDNMTKLKTVEAFISACHTEFLNVN